MTNSPRWVPQFCSPRLSVLYEFASVLLTARYLPTALNVKFTLGVPCPQTTKIFISFCGGQSKAVQEGRYTFMLCLDMYYFELCGAF